MHYQSPRYLGWPLYIGHVLLLVEILLSLHFEVLDTAEQESVHHSLKNELDKITDGINIYRNNLYYLKQIFVEFSISENSYTVYVWFLIKYNTTKKLNKN